MKLLKLYKKAGILVFLLLEAVVFAFIAPNFLSGKNIMNLLRQVAMLGIATTGISFIMIGGNAADLSIAGQIPTLTMLCGVFMKWWNIDPAIAMAMTLALGVFLGYLNGTIIKILKINPFVVTLSTMTILSGVALLFTGGVSISSLPESFSWLGQGYIWKVPAPIIVMFACVFAAQFVLSKTHFGRSVYCMGGNPEAARLAGINIEHVRLFTFMISGFFAAISALMISSRTMIASPTAGSSYGFDTMTACVLGGISFAGGEGQLWGAFVGVLIIGVLNNAMTLMNVGSYWQSIIKGIILVLALYLDRKQHEVNA